MPSSQMLNSDEWEYKCEGLGNVILSHVDQQHHTTSKVSYPCIHMSVFIVELWNIIW